MPKYSMEAKPLGKTSLTDLQQLQHFAELGRLSASLLHEISNPLTAALLHLDQVKGPKSTGIRKVRRDMQVLRRYVEAAQQQLRQESRPSSFCVRPQLEQIVRIVGPLARNSGVQLVIDPIPHCRLRGDPVKLQHILANLVVNAVDAYRQSSPASAKLIGVRLGHTIHTLTIEVIDWGEGIPQENLKRIFQPFYTTKNRTGHGLGIGLALIKQSIIADFNGLIKVSSSRSKGTSFTVSLPITACRHSALKKATNTLC